MRVAIGLVVALLAATAQAQTVSMAGSLGTRALLVIDGKPRQVAIGETVGGVKLLLIRPWFSRRSRDRIRCTLTLAVPLTRGSGCGTRFALDRTFSEITTQSALL